MANSESGQYLTVREVAERLRLHPITVRRHIAAGRILAVRIGRAVRVAEEEVSKFGHQETRIAERQAQYRTKTVPKHPYRWRPTAEEKRRRRRAVDAILRFRARQKPGGPSAEQLVREGRKELERRTNRHLGLDH
jgi:excisionase family DNA binding protein